ncbi:MAG: Type III restriction-modification system methylation subunit (EC [uncultured Campylobacterales bacterium]|uniref:site-specific DNA-methyltransferase (adenine-specific) n=1 Tax=uncultured Campylobacterales bacterium TaxID=352960 RepID=A0A6S6SE75_9BACT|nr:MAG: Type III restriction-modification system methylation subunit (EC [uncultured Campylobacterales bacterium]
MAQTENQKKLLKILNEIFQLDQSDLDFGIYRIMNTKSKEINEFLDKDLLSSVSKAFSSNDNSAIQKELDELIKTLTNAGMNADDSPKVQELKDSLSSSSTSSNLENEVFSHLANFFKRYYKDGDFVSLRRYKKDTYAIPYEGEEVKLHWANSDQYYIKSGEYFRDYTFTVNDKVNGEARENALGCKTIHLKLSDAETESNNNKATSDKERRFVVLEDNPCEVIDDELYINFEYKAIGKENQDKLNEKAIAKALESIEDLDFISALNTLAATEKNKKRTIFEKHLKSYTSRNSFDYFIHKDLGGFLGRELDFYIKNEMLFLDDIMDSPIKYDEVMGKIKIFKNVSQKIIAFLTQLEELQKKLWEKKKFIIETNYCITLDKIEEKHYSHIFENKEQLEEWKILFDVDVQSVDDLKKEKYLLLDTKFFDTKFKYKLLSQFDNLDEDIDGVLINSENFGALNLLQDRYKEQVKTVYIDPPYNTGSDGFLYADTYQHSSWMSFMYDRLALGRELMSDDGVIFSSIDDKEQHNLKVINDLVFGINNFNTNIGWQKRYTRSNNTIDFTTVLEFILVFSKTDDFIVNLLPRTKEADDRYTNPDKDKRGSWKGASFLNPATPKERPNLCYPIINPNTNIETNPTTNAWRRSKEEFAKLLIENKLYWGIDGKQAIPSIKMFLSEARGLTPTNFWEHGYAGNTDEGTLDLFKLFNNKLFNNPKPIKLIKRVFEHGSNKSSTVLDYFAGSGTTGNAVINLNREDNGTRKYILVEMGEYFDSVTKPRIQKVIYTDSWKDGKPQTKNGISQIFKYFKLESYEDTLNNLEFKRTKEQEETLDMYDKAKDDYILNYSLRFESQASLLNIDTFKTPFDYKLKIATSSVGETKDTPVDLVETFNYLLGLVVKRIELLYPKGTSSQAQGESYLVIEGQNLKKEKILIIWRDGQSSEELNEFFKKMDWSVKTSEFDTIYVNGDNNLDNLRKDEDHYKVKLIEQEFKKLMFGE